MRYQLDLDKSLSPRQHNHYSWPQKPIIAQVDGAGHWGYQQWFKILNPAICGQGGQRVGQEWWGDTSFTDFWITVASADIMVMLIRPRCKVDLSCQRRVTGRTLSLLVVLNRRSVGGESEQTELGVLGGNTRHTVTVGT